ncbi:hypothetical protein DB43_AC00030 [Parachlamydia acanthamoebae]|uniref:Uncharacterized protein n=1 Tax=Parachlamydia acanthamoebae TaxID=83552 RepID=A0A0C1E8X4_9BACT|nr:hypothetical protein DB43_AC00030 [Parachlamydia acanthamoebae]
MLSIHPPHSVPQVLLMPLLYDQFFSMKSPRKKCKKKQMKKSII